MEYYIYNIPVFLTVTLEPGVDIDILCSEIEELLDPTLLENVEVVYIGDFMELDGRNALYNEGAIYMDGSEPTNFDMLENFVHEVAHSLEDPLDAFIYDEELKYEFLGKRRKLFQLLSGQGFHINPKLYSFTEYNKKFDHFLANVVGYPTLLSLTIGLFISPYGATSLPEYFANGFEKYFLDSPRSVKAISPVLYRKIERIINDKTNR